MDRSLAPCHNNSENYTWKTRQIWRSGHIGLEWQNHHEINTSIRHRIIGANIGWGRKKTMHVMCIYGLDTGQTSPPPEEGNKVLRARISEHLAKIGR
eukprot:9176213-Heterocapsa_arctica.AAC.1